MWESPIQISTISEEIGRKIVDDQNNYIVETCVKMGVSVDKDELIKALKYDRGQYTKGYIDGKIARDDEIVRCRDCKYKYVPDDIEDKWCYWVDTDEDDFCSYGERKEATDADANRG